MAHPRVADKLKREGVGLSIDGRTLARIDALSGGSGKRSSFLRELIFIGLEHRFGKNWTEGADRLVEIEVRAEAERFEMMSQVTAA